LAFARFAGGGALGIGMRKAPVQLTGEAGATGLRKGSTEPRVSPGMVERNWEFHSAGFAVDKRLCTTEPFCTTERASAQWNGGRAITPGVCTGVQAESFAF
jgi:hypothetical protein